MRRIRIAAAAIVAIGGSLLAACSDGETVTTVATPHPADYNGDGVVRIGVATAGPRDDGAYYQAMVEKVEEISADHGFAAPLIVDGIDPANSRVELKSIAEQGVDIIAIGSEEVARDNEDLFTAYDEIFWYCNCGSLYRDTPGLFRSADSGAELNMSAGYAAGLLLQERGGDRVAFLGCCDLPFEFESLAGFEFGLHQVDPGLAVTYVATGQAPYDFDNTAGATEAYHNAVAEGADAVYPFLGGAHEPIVRLANEDGLIVNTAGSSKGCERDDLDYDFEVMFDAGDYLEPLFEEILAGTAEEGGARYFTVGIDPQVGAVFCDATPEQVALLDAFNRRIGNGDFDAEIDRILTEAHGL